MHDDPAETAGDPTIEVITQPAPAELGPIAFAQRDLGPRLYVTWVAMIMAAGLFLGVAFDIVVVSRLQYWSSQTNAFNHFRVQLANGTAPVAQLDASGNLIKLGTPMALLQIPSIHLKETVEEGTTPTILMSGPGHRRDTPFPGQGGGVPSIIMGRQAAYGGPFSRIDQLKVGASIVVTTGEGISKFKVIDVRKAGDPIPPTLGAGQARLTLQTATGLPFLPSGVVSVDADLTTPVLASGESVIPVGGIPSDEKAMGINTSDLWELVFVLQGLTLLAVLSVWSWHRWGKVQTWIVFTPAVFVVGLLLSAQITQLLPNLT